jgi:hypothetical protein
MKSEEKIKEMPHVLKEMLGRMENEGAYIHGCNDLENAARTFGHILELMYQKCRTLVNVAKDVIKVDRCDDLETALYHGGWLVT